MNKTYKLIFSRRYNQFVVASEAAKTQGKASAKGIVVAAGVAAVLIGLPQQEAWATDASTTAGSVSTVNTASSISNISLNATLGSANVSTESSIYSGVDFGTVNYPASGNITFNGATNITISGTKFLSWGDHQIVSSGGTEARTIIVGGTQTINSGGVVISASIQPGGVLTLSGSNTAGVDSGGTQTVNSGGTALSSTVLNGGRQTLNGGIASGTIISSGGSLHISSGGVAIAASINNGGIAYVSSGGASYNTQISSGGQEVILAGGYGPNATISAGGTQTIMAGGSDLATTVQSGGAQVVGGVASAAVINGGTQLIISGGSGVGGVVNGGTVSASSGSYVQGYAISGNGGTLVAAGVVAGAASGGAAIAVTSGTSNTVLLNQATLNGNVTFAGNANTLTLTNGTALGSAGVALTDTTSANTLILTGSQSLALANTPTSGAAVVSGWQQFNVSSGASLRLTGSAVNLAVGALNNAGTLNVGAGQTLTITGNYSQTGTLTVGVSSPSAYGQTLVNGNASLGGQLTISPGSTLASDTRYSNIFRATGTTTGSFTGTGHYGLVDYSAVANSNGGVDLLTTQNNALKPLFNGGLANAVRNLSEASLQVIRDRLDGANAATPQDNDSGNALWITPYGSYGKQSGGSGTSANAYTQKTAGLALGTDTPLDNGLRLGGALSIQNTGYNGNSPTQDGATTTSYQFTGYARQKIGEATELRFIANFAGDRHSSIRLDPNSQQTATASYNGWHGVWSSELNHNLDFGEVIFTPLARVDVAYAKVQGYNESGPAASTFNVGAQSSTSLVTAVGGRFRYDLDDTQRILGRASVGYDFAAKSSSVTATDVNGISITANSRNAGPVVTQAGIGYEIATASDRLRVRANYDYYGRAGYSNHMLNLSLIVPF